MQAEIGGDNYKVIQHTQNSDQCAALCASDAACVAWTRVAGGRSDVRSCYLKNSLAGVAGAPEASNSMLQRAQVRLDAVILYSKPWHAPKTAEVAIRVWPVGCGGCALLLP